MLAPRWNYAVQFYANCFPTLPHLEFNYACENCAIHLHNSSRFVDAFLNWRSALECDSGGDESGQSVFHPYPRPQQLAQVWQTAEKLIWSHHSLWGSSWGGHGWATDLFRCTRLVWSPRLAGVHDSFLLKEGQSKPIGHSRWGWHCSVTILFIGDQPTKSVTLY